MNNVKKDGMGHSLLHIEFCATDPQIAVTWNYNTNVLLRQFSFNFIEQLLCSFSTLGGITAYLSLLVSCISSFK